MIFLGCDQATITVLVDGYVFRMWSRRAALNRACYLLSGTSSYVYGGVGGPLFQMSETSLNPDVWQSASGTSMSALSAWVVQSQWPFLVDLTIAAYYRASVQLLTLVSGYSHTLRVVG